MRPKQWYKNLVIFIGIVFSLNLLNFNLWINVISAFVTFCLLSGSIYIINDCLDVEKDRNHPKKCKRPLASGRLKTSHEDKMAAPPPLQLTNLQDLHIRLRILPRQALVSNNG